MLRSTENLIYALRALDPKRKQRLEAARRQRDWKRRRKAQGLCTQCGRGASRPGGVRCQACTETNRQRVKEFRAERERRGLCRQCGKPHPRRDHERELYAARRAAGKCYRCGRRPPFRDRCACRPCLQRLAETAQRVRDRRSKAHGCM